MASIPVMGFKVARKLREMAAAMSAMGEYSSAHSAAKGNAMSTPIPVPTAASGDLRLRVGIVLVEAGPVAVPELGDLLLAHALLPEHLPELGGGAPG